MEGIIVRKEQSLFEELRNVILNIRMSVEFFSITL
jgi:hypothetical protein